MLPTQTQEVIFRTVCEQYGKLCQISHTDNFEMLWSDFHNVNILIVVDLPVETQINVEQGHWSAFRIICNTGKWDS